MEFLLDGNDWEADYFASFEQSKNWRTSSRIQHRTLLDSAIESGFLHHAVYGGTPLRGSVPGSDRSFLQANGLADEPYFARNLDRSRWSENHAWAFRKQFLLPEQWRECRRILLHCKGIDYRAHFFLNGIPLGCRTGMFIPVCLDVTEAVRPGEENLLAVAFEPAPQASPNHHSAQSAEFAQFHRCQMSFGWDWARPMLPVGIWDSISLFGYRQARVKDSYLQYMDGHLRLQLDIRSQEEVRLPLRLCLSPLEGDASGLDIQRTLQLEAGENQFIFPLELEGIRLWHPNGNGPQPLYRLHLELDGIAYDQDTGFRELRMIRNPNSPEDAYPLTFQVNDYALFAKGLNWVPMNLDCSQNRPDEYERLVRLAAEGGFNLFRVWGGGMVDKDAFYDACDRHGMLVWQEFPHACSNYPKTPEYLAFKRNEATAILKKLRRHPCLALLCGGNELQYYGEIPDSPMLLQYGQLAKELVPSLPYHISCPDLSRPGEANHGPWSYQEHRAYNEHHRLLASEIGCNGMPELESLRHFIPASELEAMHGQALRYHFFNDVPGDKRNLLAPLGVFAIRNMKELCQASMFAQADAVSYAMEHYRRRSPTSSGCFIWQYNEPWPTCAWSIVDFYSRPKMAYYALKRANAPLMLSLEDESWCVQEDFTAVCHLVNDGEETSGRCVFRLMDIHGNVLAEKSIDGKWPCGSTAVGHLRLSRPTPCENLLLARLEYHGENGCRFRNTRIYGAPNYRNAFLLPQAMVKATPLECQGGRLRYELYNVSEVAALNVCARLECLPESECFWSDNYITLLPGESTVLEVTPARMPASVPRLRLSAWNFDA